MTIVKCFIRLTTGLYIVVLLPKNEKSVLAFLIKNEADGMTVPPLDLVQASFYNEAQLWSSVNLINPPICFYQISAQVLDDKYCVKVLILCDPTIR